MARQPGLAGVLMSACGVEKLWGQLRLGLLVSVAFFLVSAAMVEGPARRTMLAAGTADVDSLMDRAQATGQSWGHVASYYETQVAPLENVLVQYRDDRVLAKRIARALVKEGNRVHVEPRLLLAVLLVENPWINPSAVSPVGARGLMQVMPLHTGNWRRCPATIDTIEANICYGAQIFADNLRLSEGDVERALLRYNGCVRGTNTPNCDRYPQHVFASAGRASVQAWTRPSRMAD